MAVNRAILLNAETNISMYFVSVQSGDNPSQPKNMSWTEINNNNTMVIQPGAIYI